MKKYLLIALAMITSAGIATAADGLDPDYVYAEPTVVTNTEELGSNIANYTFISNNVQVSVTKGARYATEGNTYFGVNAGESVTLTTTKPMKAIVVNGYLKKYFEATSSSGDIAFADADDDAVEGEQVLAVTNIDATTLTINCVKQLRCYSVSVYFEENPEVSIETGGGEDDYSYEWEPQEPKTFNLQFDSLRYLDMSANLGYACTSIVLYNDEAELEMVFFASTTGDEHVLPQGTYPINDTYTEGTVQASVGGYEEFDFPTCLYTDYETDEDGTQYYTPYYVVSGMAEVVAVEGGVEIRVEAETHFGSTIRATYRDGEGEPNEGNAVEQVNSNTYSGITKTLKEGRIVILHHGARYTTEGIMLQEE